MPRSPVPGEAVMNPRVTRMAVVQNVALATLFDEVHVDAVIDTGATLCIVPPIFARQLGFDSSNGLRGGPIRVIGGSTVQINEHRLEWVRVGSAMAYDVEIGVCTTFAGSRNMLASHHIKVCLYVKRLDRLGPIAGVWGFVRFVAKCNGVFCPQCADAEGFSGAGNTNILTVVRHQAFSIILRISPSRRLIRVIPAWQQFKNEVVGIATFVGF
jgi:hypothetical protein